MRETIAHRILRDTQQITRGVDRIKIIAPLTVNVVEDWKGGWTKYIFKDESYILWTWDKMSAREPLGE